MSSRPTRLSVSLLVGAALVVVGLVGGAWLLWPRLSAEPEADVATASPSPEPEPTDDATAEEDELEHLQTLEGYASVDDPSEDLADASGVPPPEPEPAADLDQVELEGDGEGLTVTFHVQDRLPIQTSSLAWSLNFFIPVDDDEEVQEDDAVEEDPEGDDVEPVEGAVPEDLAYTVTVQQSGQERMAAVMDWSSSAQTSLDAELHVDEETIALTVPADALERLDGPFEWRALGQFDGAYQDYAPDSGRAEFPEVQASPTPSPTPTEAED